MQSWGIERRKWNRKKEENEEKYLIDFGFYKMKLEREEKSGRMIEGWNGMDGMMLMLNQRQKTQTKPNLWDEKWFELSWSLLNKRLRSFYFCFF